jgi:hypothetical protein
MKYLLAFLLAGAFSGSVKAQNVIQPIRYEAQGWFIPRHVPNGGDADFKGHGPNVWLKVQLYIKPQAPNEVWALVEMQAVETKRDWTTAAGVTHVRVATFARPITQIVTPTQLGNLVNGELKPAFVYTDTNHNLDTINNPCACGVINRAHFVGDMRGREAGTRTGVWLEFNPILAR